jgi:hypothetical protein
MSGALRRLIRHAEVYGVAGVFEAAAGELSAAELESLARRLARIDPNWSGNGNGPGNPHSNGANRYESRGADPVVPPALRNSSTAVCRKCGRVFEATSLGRPRRYCSNACRQAAYRARAT